MQTVLEIKLVIVIKTRLSSVINANTDMEDTIGLRILESHTEIPVSALLTALPSTVTHPMKVMVVMPVVLVALRKVVIGFPFTWMMHRSASATITGAVEPHVS